MFRRRRQFNRVTRRRLALEHVEPRILFDASQDVPCDLVCTGDETGGDTTQTGQLLPGFSLVDVNSASPTANDSVSPRDYLGSVSVWYFSHASCSYCRSLFGYLDTMQDDLAAAYPQLNIDFLGVNVLGEEASNDLITAGRDLPWLQDVDANQDGNSDAWQLWQAAWRDVIILDGGNHEVGRINLTTHNLGDAANYTLLRDMVVEAAFADQRPWCNWRNVLDPNNDSTVNVADAQFLIQTLNSQGSGQLAEPTSSGQLPGYYDCDGNGFFTPQDCLLVINYLNEHFTPAELNGVPQTTADAYTLSEDLARTVTASQGVLANDRDPNNDSLVANLVSNPQHGTLTWSNTGAFTYTPAANYQGTDSFQYVAFDGRTSSTPTVVSLTIAGVNDAPQGVADSYTVGNSGQLRVNAATGVLKNDTDLDGDTLTAAVASFPAHGSISLSPDGSFTYTPATEYVGSDTFTYTVADGHGGTATGTVSLQVAATNTFTVTANSAAGTLVGQVATNSTVGANRVYELVNSSLAADLNLAADDHFSGDLSASAVLIEYIDIQCPPCATYHPVVRQLETNFAGDLLVVRRHLPLTTIHPNAFAAAVAAEAAGRQGAFDEFIDLAYQNQSSWSSLSNSAAQTAFEGFVTTLGLNLTRFRTDVADPTTTARVQRDMTAASNLSVNGTPTFFLNGQRLSGPPATASGFGSLIQTALNQSTAVFELDRGTGRLQVRLPSALNPGVQPSFDFNVRVRDTAGNSQIIPVRVNVAAAAEGESDWTEYVSATDALMADLGV